jgi:hypothetical protein
MRDEHAQSLGVFPAYKGSKLTHEKLKAFIARNYQADADGRWYFQNGPQRVFVELEITPWVWRLQSDGRVMSHTDKEARAQRCWMDELGHVYLETNLGIGLVHSMDMYMAAQHIESGLWVPQSVNFRDMPQRFSYVLSPHAAHDKQA